MAQGPLVHRPIRMSILSGSGDQLSLFPLQAPGIKPRPPTEVERGFNH